MSIEKIKKYDFFPIDFCFFLLYHPNKERIRMSLSYFEIWRGIDRLAQNKGLSPSGLAIKAGLDPTSFNKSKRIGPDGKRRWLSMESLNKVLSATHTSFLEFISLCGQEALSSQSLPLIVTKDLLTYTDEKGYFIPSDNIDTFDIPMALPNDCYAVELSQGIYNYQPGDILIVNPQTEIRRGDRIIIKHGDTISIDKFIRQTKNTLETENENIDIDTVDWMTRIIWVRQ